MISLRCIPQKSLDTYVAPLDQTSAWSMFKGPSGSILGAHVVSARSVPLYNGDLWIFTVRVSNGACSPNGKDFCGRVYYSSLWIEAQSVWLIEPDVPRCQGTFGGSKLPLVTPGLHVFPAGKQFVRRFALRRGSVTTAQARAELDRVDWRSERLQIARDNFGASKLRLPDIDVPRQEKLYAGKLVNLRAALKLGAPIASEDIRGPALGPFQPPGNTTAYEQGGQGIYFAPIEQSPSAILHARTLADLWQERMTTACFDRTTGERITSEQWALGAGSTYQPFETAAHGDEEARDAYAANKFPHYPPALNPDKLWNSGTCPYESALAEYDTVDDAHLTRATLPAKVGAFLLGDEACIDFLCDLGHHERMAQCDIGPKPDEWSRSLRAQIERAIAKPGQGFPSQGRSRGWLLDLGATWIALARSKAETLAATTWTRKQLQLSTLVAMPSGLVQRCIEGHGDAPSIWDSFGMPRDQDGSRTFEDMIELHGNLTAQRALDMLPADPPSWLGRAVRAPFLSPDLARCLRAAKSLLDNPAFAPGPYDGGKQRGPPNCVAVAPKGAAPYKTLTLGRGADPAHVEAVLAQLYRATGNRRWLDLLLVYGYPAKSLQAKRAWYQAAVNGELPGVQDVAWYVEPLSAVQEFVA